MNGEHEEVGGTAHGVCERCGELDERVVDDAGYRVCRECEQDRRECMVAFRSGLGVRG